MVTVEGRKAPEPDRIFSSAELAQAISFVQLVQRAEGNLIVTPELILQMRYCIDEERALALIAHLEQIGCWVIFTDEAGRRCAQVLRG